MKDKCAFQGLTYDDGTGLCAAGKCMICSNGEWRRDESMDIRRSEPTQE